MKPEEAAILLQKYFDGDTSLKEERTLRNYFLQEEVPDELLPYRKWFAVIGEPQFSPGSDPYAEEMARFISGQEKPVRYLNRKMIFSLSGIAASVIIVVGSLLYFQREPVFRDTFSDPAEAIACAEKTLAFVSAKYNQGFAALEPFAKLSSSQEKLTKNIKIIRNGFTEINKIQVINKLKIAD